MREHTPDKRVEYCSRCKCTRKFLRVGTRYQCAAPKCGKLLYQREAKDE